MIVTRLELWPLGDPRAIESIAIVTIANAGPAGRGRHRYHVRCGGEWVTVTHRREAGALVLLERALRAFRSKGLGTEPAPDPEPAVALAARSRLARDGR